ncbi:MAG: glycosyl transferase [archaeon GW2011_AR17]|nr:MAG: glycosyl transferase [archaeon GW2011_AR17]MBS3154096.1 glycosyltransferase family 4 protein [Candidatus Woesearchaeota archaeon]HIH14688.1 glycosyltransferase family 4 protein [Nanoarchaeota archaeon]HIH59141.1 glycosyltransferase family 4 protein [Nanoarchaeota archaeon]HII14369.1 glycosyltransferase family 4 protein [Nanoarchaeota archaeon]
MDVLIFTECPTEDYYRALLYLEKKGKAKVRFLDSRTLYLFFLKLYSSHALLRKIGHRYFGKPLDIDKKVRWKDVGRSFLGYFTLVFTQKKIIALFAPYHSLSPYLYFLKLLGKDIVFMTSWPYWNEQEYVHRPLPFVRFFWKQFLQNISLVTISQTGKIQLEKYSSHVTQIPHAVDIETFHPGKKKSFQVLFVGRIIPEKGIQGILDAARQLKHIPFVFVGSGSAVSLVQNSGLKNVCYLGEIRDREKLAQIFRESSVFVLNSYKIPGWEELYGIVLLESLASETPVISTDCVGPQEIVQKEFGFLIPQKDTDALKEKIQYCFEHQGELEKMGEEGRTFVEKYYDIENLSGKWYAVLISKTFKA